MAKFKIEPGRDGNDFVLVGGTPVGVISRHGHGRVTTCTIEGARTHGANGECVIGVRPAWVVKAARGLAGGRGRRRQRQLGATWKVMNDDGDIVGQVDAMNMPEARRAAKAKFGTADVMEIRPLDYYEVAGRDGLVVGYVKASDVLAADRMAKEQFGPDALPHAVSASAKLTPVGQRYWSASRAR